MNFINLLYSQIKRLNPFRPAMQKDQVDASIQRENEEETENQLKNLFDITINMAKVLEENKKIQESLEAERRKQEADAEAMLVHAKKAALQAKNQRKTIAENLVSPSFVFASEGASFSRGMEMKTKNVKNAGVREDGSIRMNASIIWFNGNQIEKTGDISMICDGTKEQFWHQEVEILPPLMQKKIDLFDEYPWIPEKGALAEIEVNLEEAQIISEITIHQVSEMPFQVLYIWTETSGSEEKKKWLYKKEEHERKNSEEKQSFSFEATGCSFFRILIWQPNGKRVMKEWEKENKERWMQPVEKKRKRTRSELNLYGYGISEIEVSHRTYEKKLIYVSKVLPVTGGVNSVQVELDAEFKEKNGIPLHGAYVSVTNKQYAKEEEWLPLLPAGTEFVHYEKITPADWDEKGCAFRLRHESKTMDVRITRNFLDLPFSWYECEEDMKTIYVMPEAVRKGDVFHASYAPVKNSDRAFFSEEAELYIEEEGTIGERFETSENQKVKLKQTPYYELGENGLFQEKKWIRVFSGSDEYRFARSEKGEIDERLFLVSKNEILFPGEKTELKDIRVEYYWKSCDLQVKIEMTQNVPGTVYETSCIRSYFVSYESG